MTTDELQRSLTLLCVHTTATALYAQALGNNVTKMSPSETMRLRQDCIEHATALFHDVARFTATNLKKD